MSAKLLSSTRVDVASTISARRRRGFGVAAVLTGIAIHFVCSEFAQAQPQGPPLEFLKNELKKSGAPVKPGAFFPQAQVPIDPVLMKYRACVIGIGNHARRDPNYRKTAKYWGEHGLQNAKYARDLSGDMADTVEGKQKIYKHNRTPPYFHDLVFNQSLNKAAQFHAEYLASIPWNAKTNPGKGHEGPKAHNVAGVMTDMTTLGMRAKAFGYKFTVTEEGAGGGFGSTPLDWAPEWWLQSDSHYRSWFNVNFDVKEIGIGVAKGPGNTGWYFCVLYGTGK